MREVEETTVLDQTINIRYPHLSVCNSLLDIYNREKKLAHWINKVNTDLGEPDKTDVLKCIQHMQDNENSALWIINFITNLLSLRKKLYKSFRDCSKDNIRNLIHEIDNQNYTVKTIEKYRSILKQFFKIVYGENEYFPDTVKWIKTNPGKDKRSLEKKLDMAKFFDQEDIIKLIENAPTLQKKAFIACLYETGARPEEFLRLTNTDIKLETNSAALILRGKTGERQVRVIVYYSILQEWLDIHPFKNLSRFPIWISESTNYKNKQLGRGGSAKIIKKAGISAGISNKKLTLYTLRHSRATHLANHFTEPKMWKYFGWVPGTNVTKIYIHLSGVDVDEDLFALSEGKERRDTFYKLKSLKCIKCKESLSPNSNFCSKCALPINLSEQYLQEKDIESENHKLKLDFENYRKETDNKISKILDIIAVHPELSCIKSEILQKKIII